MRLINAMHRARDFSLLYGRPYYVTETPYCVFDVTDKRPNPFARRATFEHGHEINPITTPKELS